MKKIIILFLIFINFSLFSDETVNVNLVGYPRLISFSLNLNNKSEVTIDGKKYSTNILYMFPQKKIVVTDKGEDISFKEILVISNGITKIDCKYGAQSYKGDFIITNKNDEIILINKVKIDDYFAGVLGAELGESFSMETLKAQAVAIRSYYYSRKNKYKDQSFDINNTDGIDMVYRGSEFATPRMYNAFRDTADLYLVDDNNNIAMPLFHSTSGGIILKDEALTSDFYDNNSNMILLVDKDKNNIPYSINSPYYKFSINLSENDLLEITKDETKIANLTDIKLNYFSDTTCVNFIGFIDQNNSTHWLKCYKFISLVQKKGFYDFRSIQFKYKKEGQNYLFYGEGFGHLCGMSQYSAEYLAKKGASFREILNKYYPFFKIKNIR